MTETSDRKNREKKPKLGAANNTTINPTRYVFQCLSTICDTDISSRHLTTVFGCLYFTFTGRMKVSIEQEGRIEKATVFCIIKSNTQFRSHYQHLLILDFVTFYLSESDQRTG